MCFLYIKSTSVLPSVRIFGFSLLLLFGVGFIGKAVASEEFVISYYSMPTTLDPHAMRHAPNVAMNTHVFDSLFQMSDDTPEKSLILESWTAQEARVWMLRLKKNIRFHDGTILTSKDVIYSFDRIRQLPGSEYANFLERWEHYEAVDDYTVKIVTRQPNANLIRDMSRIFILRHRDAGQIGQALENKDYIGTGPYHLDTVTSEGDILLSAHADYHGTPAFLKKVRITRIAGSPERVDALKRGKVQLLEGMAETELALLKDEEGVDVIRSPTHRILHLQLDFFRDQSPFVSGTDGYPLKENPLKNIKVRQAMSLAINRKELVNRVLLGQGVASGQYILPDVPGHIPGLEPDQWAPDEAHRLLAEAGYPDGFRLTLHGTYNRYFKDKEVVEAVAAMWSRVGIKTTPVTLDRTVFLKDYANSSYSASLMGVSTDGNLQGLLEVLVHTKNAELGLFNSGYYSNPEVDALVLQAGRQFNQVSRLRSLMQAEELAINDYAIIPLFFGKTIWGIRNDAGAEYWPSRSGYTMAFDVRKKRQQATKDKME